MPFSEQSSVLNAASSSARDIANSTFFVGIMTTRDYLAKGIRLLESCKAHAIPALLYEVPMVHQSVSTKGGTDLSFTKASFIRFLLDKYQKPVLYIDGDCVMLESPSHIFSLVQDGVDFGIYNWLADEHTEAYAPVSVQVQEGWSTVLSTDRFYRYTHSVDYFDPAQLICSGATQFWNNTPKARELLNAWHGIIQRNPRSQDDHCLDFAYNRLGTLFPGLVPRWLDKSYARYPWWPYAKPVIDHPDFPAAVPFPEDVEKREGIPRVDFRKVKRLAVTPVFPREYLIDTRDNTLVRPNLQNSFETIGPLPVPIWITRR
jgi:hypothetical protein